MSEKYILDAETLASDYAFAYQMIQEKGSKSMKDFLPFYEQLQQKNAQAKRISFDRLDKAMRIVYAFENLPEKEGIDRWTRLANAVPFTAAELLSPMYIDDTVRFEIIDLIEKGALSSFYNPLRDIMRRLKKGEQLRDIIAEKETASPTEQPSPTLTAGDFIPFTPTVGEETNGYEPHFSELLIEIAAKADRTLADIQALAETLATQTAQLRFELQELSKKGEAPRLENIQVQQ